MSRPGHRTRRKWVAMTLALPPSLPSPAPAATPGCSGHIIPEKLFADIEARAPQHPQKDMHLKEMRWG